MLRDLHISSEHVINFLERSIGVYQSDKRKSVLRTCNPFWLIGQLLDWLSHIPFILIGSAGFNETRAEQSLVLQLQFFVLGLTPLIMAPSRHPLMPTTPLAPPQHLLDTVRHHDHQTPKQTPYLRYAQGNTRPRDALKPARVPAPHRFFSGTSRWAARTTLSNASAHIDKVT